MEQEILMPPELCMQFLIWSYYYHNIEPQNGVSYRQCGRFSDADAQHLDELRDALFRTFEDDSVFEACKQLQLARTRHEQCPYPQEALDMMFAKEK